MLSTASAWQPLYQPLYHSPRCLDSSLQPFKLRVNVKKKSVLIVTGPIQQSLYDLSKPSPLQGHLVGVFGLDSETSFYMKVFICLMPEKPWEAGVYVTIVRSWAAVFYVTIVRSCTLCRCLLCDTEWFWPDTLQIRHWSCIGLILAWPAPLVLLVLQWLLHKQLGSLVWVL